ncbi:hypothetical protein K1T71_012455 [Dendrolimus kikuchii]|uniref:Uncharacterized protein n=1 Tax=Dendrolimus kikuchii TaxID=765133 RepID=A0ACC1CJD7_9NEOP|nr:hypothetical protein K1T71_012455 [Dendrolimus kikuchii]
MYVYDIKYCNKIILIFIYKFTLSICVLFYRHTDAQIIGSSTGFIASFVRTNLIGHPVIHDRTSWIFDPEVAMKRRRQFIELHGDKGERLIERLGLGIDGKDEERLAQQRARDAGRLGGLNIYLP